jgi:FixJ family two-component response regulator
VEYCGTISNVSLKGCTVTSTTLRPFSGMQMRLSIATGDGQAPLCIEKASVRWCASDLTGLEFTKMSSREQLGLNRLIQDLQDALPQQGPTLLKIPIMESKPARLTASNPAQQQIILIVDDEEAIVGVCTLILQRAGFRILKAADSFKALEICTAYQGGIDLLLTDLVLVPRGFRIATPSDRFSQVNGHDLAIQASSIRPDLRVAFMSGNPDLDLAGYGIKRGALPFISKPFSAEDLVNFVGEAVRSGTALGNRTAMSLIG